MYNRAFGDSRANLTLDARSRSAASPTKLGKSLKNIKNNKNKNMETKLLEVETLAAELREEVGRYKIDKERMLKDAEDKIRVIEELEQRLLA